MPLQFLYGRSSERDLSRRSEWEWRQPWKVNAVAAWGSKSNGIECGGCRTFLSFLRRPLPGIACVILGALPLVSGVPPELIASRFEACSSSLVSGQPPHAHCLGSKLLHSRDPGLQFTVPESGIPSSQAPYLHGAARALPELDYVAQLGSPGSVVRCNLVNP